MRLRSTSSSLLSSREVGIEICTLRRATALSKVLLLEWVAMAALPLLCNTFFIVQHLRCSTASMPQCITSVATQLFRSGAAPSLLHSTPAVVHHFRCRAAPLLPCSTTTTVQHFRYCATLPLQCSTLLERNSLPAPTKATPGRRRKRKIEHSAREEGNTKL